MPPMDKAARAAYDREYREKNKLRKAAYEAKWRADNAAHLKQRAAKRRLEKRAMCLIAAAPTPAAQAADSVLEDAARP